MLSQFKYTKEALSASDLHVKSIQIHERHPAVQFVRMTNQEFAQVEKSEL